MAERVLITGANGFLGRHLVAELLGRGYEVRALVRPGVDASPLPPLSSLPIEVYEGDLGQPATLTGAADGCQAIIHAAALAQVNPARDPAVWAVNHAGTAAVLALAQQAAVRRLVYVGTANVFGFGPRQQPGDETSPYAGQPYGLDYMDSKRAATDLVQQAATQQGLPAVLVHPTFMLGPGDAKPTSNALLLALWRGQVPGYPAGGKNYVHVRDVAVATVNALTMGRVGESYILGNENLSYREAFALIGSIVQVRAPRWPVPFRLARAYAIITGWWAGRTGQLPLLNPAMVAVARDGHYFGVGKARAELALPRTPVAQAVAESFTWFKHNGYLD